jgi:hypothetical protein
MRTALVIVALSLLFVVPACGGDEPTAADEAVTVETGEAADELERRADEVEAILEDRVRGLGDVGSPDDLSDELEGARADLDRAADDIAETKVPEDRVDERAELEKRVRDLSSELDEVKERVDDEDVVGALDELRDLDSLDELENVLSRIRNEGR